MTEMIHKQYTAEIKDIDLEKRQMTMAISTEAKDRDGDIIEIAGWNLKAFKKNPVVLFAHTYNQPAIGKSVKIWTESKKLMSRTEFAPTPLGGELWALYSQGYMKATSVGFIPHEWDIIEPKEGEENVRPGKRYKKQELLEYSLVPVPSNPQALSLAKAKGLKTEEVEALMEETTEKPYPNEHACRLKPPGGYDRIRRVNCAQKHDGKCIDVIYGVKANKSEIQSLRYPKKIWTASDARAHCKSREGSFEAARAEESSKSKDPVSQAEIADDLDYIRERLTWGIDLKDYIKPLAKEVAEMLLRETGDDTAVDIEEEKGAALSRKDYEALRQAQELISQVIERAQPEGDEAQGLDVDELVEALASRILS